MTRLHDKTEGATRALLAAIAFAAVVGMFNTQAVAAPPGNSNNSFAVGGFSTATDHVAFAAHRNPNNGSITGHVVREDNVTGSSSSGPVTCLFVSADGKSARIGWTVTNSNDPMVCVGTTRQFDVTDNGEPVGGMPPDKYTDLGACLNQCDSWNPNGCGCCTTNGGFCMLIHGNIIVRGPSS